MLGAARYFIPTELIVQIRAECAAGFVLLAAHLTYFRSDCHGLTPFGLSRVLGVHAEHDHIPQIAAGAACAGQTLSLEVVDSLVAAELESELAVEIGLGDVELDVVDIGALVLCQSVDIELALAGVYVALVAQNLGGDLALVVHNDLRVVGDTAEGQLLRGGIVSELAGSSLVSLRQLLIRNTGSGDGVQLGDLGAGGADCFIAGDGLIFADGQIIRPLDLGHLVLKLAAGLHFKKAAGQHAVLAADGNGFVALQGRKLSALLTGNIDLLLTLRDGSVAQLIKSEKMILLCSEMCYAYCQKYPPLVFLSPVQTLVTCLRCAVVRFSAAPASMIERNKPTN